MKTKFAVPEHLKELYEIEGYKAMKAADATSLLVGEVSTAVSAAFRKDTPGKIELSWKLLQEQYEELRDMSLAGALNGNVVSMLEEFFRCREEEVGKETPRKKAFTAKAQSWAEEVGKITVS